MDSFLFYRSFWEAIQEMTPEDQLEAYEAICGYALNEEEPEIQGVMPRTVFNMAKPTLDANRARRLNGKKGGRPKKETYGFETKKPMVFENENLWFQEKEAPLVSPLSLPPEPPITLPPIIPPEKEKPPDTQTSCVSPPRGTPTRIFKPPSVEEVQEYCKQRGNSVDPQRFVDFYTMKGWMVGKNKMKDWKAAVRTWERQENGPPTPMRQEKFPPKSENEVEDGADDEFAGFDLGRIF